MDDQPSSLCLKTSKYAVTEAFNNVLVWRNLSRFLNLSDLKCLRLTCKDFNDHVLNSTNFKCRTIVNILQNRVKKFGTTTTLWKNLKIPYEGLNTTEYEKNDSLDWLYPLLTSVEMMTIVVKNYNPSLDCSLTYPSLEKLLEAPMSLKMLVIGVAVLKAPETPIALSNLSEKALSNLNNLNGLHLMQCFNLHDFYTSGDDIFRSSTKFLLPLLNNLSTIIIESLSTKPKMNITSDKKSEESIIKLCQNLIQIILNNRNQIVDLKIDDPRLWSRRCNTNLLTILDSDVIFPRLKSLRMVAANSQKNYVIDFLKRQPNLEELDITIHNRFPNVLMKVIQEKSKMLKRLRIRTKGFEKIVKDRWIFLSGLQLEDFQLDFTNSFQIDENCGKHLLKTVMKNLPSSIKKISVQSHCSHSDGYLVPSDFAKIKEDKLTYFNVRVSDTIRNSTLKFIFNNFKNLEHLDIRGSMEKCTDIGFTGINKLTGLKSLKFDCYNLSNTTFKEICLNDLKVLGLGLPHDDSNEEMSNEGSEGLNILLKRNKSLEIIRTSSTIEFLDFPSLNEMQKLNPRIRWHVVPGGFDPERLQENENDPYQSEHEYLIYSSSDEA